MDVLPVHYLTHKGALINSSMNYTTQSEARVPALWPHLGVWSFLLSCKTMMCWCAKEGTGLKKRLLTPVFNEGSLSICLRRRDYRHVVWFEEEAIRKR